VIGDLPALSRECDVTAARLDRLGGGGGHRKKGDDQPLLVKVRHDGQTVSDVVDGVLSLLYEWTDHVAAFYGESSLPLQVRGDVRPPRHLLVPTAAGTLLRHVDWMRSDEQGPDLAHAVWTVRRDLRVIIDRPPERTYAGPCQSPLLVMGADPDQDGPIRFVARETRCKRELYRKWGSDVITCDGYDPDPRLRGGGCGAQHLAINRDVWLVASVTEELLPLRLLWESLYVLVPGCLVDWETVRRWPRRNNGSPPRLIAHTLTPMGQPLYRGGDVLALARDTMPRRGKRRITRLADTPDSHVV